MNELENLKKRITQTFLLILFLVMMLFIAQDEREKESARINLEIIENQKIIRYIEPIGLHPDKIDTIIGEKREKLKTSFIEQVQVVFSINSKNEYKQVLKAPITLDTFGENNYYKTTIENSLMEYNDTFESKYEKHLERVKYLNDLKSNGFLKTEGNVSLDNLEVLYSYYEKIPKNVRDSIETNGWNIYLTTKNLANTFFYGQYNSVLGATLYGEKTIYIENRRTACKSAIVHEVGHAIDALNGFVSCNATFIAIYNEESAGFVEVGGNGNHARSSCMEYFAEAFNQAILYPASCQKHSPKTYEFIMNIVNGQ